MPSGFAESAEARTALAAAWGPATWGANGRPPGWIASAHHCATPTLFRSVSTRCKGLNA